MRSEILDKARQHDTEQECVDYIIANKGSAFIYNAGLLENTVSELYNMRLPDEDIRRGSAKWYYEKAMQAYDNALNCRDCEYEKREIEAEKEMFRKVYEYLK